MNGAAPYYIQKCVKLFLIFFLNQCLYGCDFRFWLFLNCDDLTI